MMVIGEDCPELAPVWRKVWDRWIAGIKLDLAECSIDSTQSWSGKCVIKTNHVHSTRDGSCWWV